MPHFPAVQRGTNAQTSTTCVASTLVAQHSHSYIAHTARMNNSAQTGRAKDKSKCQSAPPPPPLARYSQKWRVWDSCPTEHRTQHAHAFTHPPSAPLAAYALEPSAYSCDGAFITCGEHALRTLFRRDVESRGRYYESGEPQKVMVRPWLLLECALAFPKRAPVPAPSRFNDTPM